MPKHKRERWWSGRSLPRRVGDAFFYAPLASSPVLVFGCVLAAFVAADGAAVAWSEYVGLAVVSLVFGMPAVYVAMVALALPAVLVLRRLDLRSAFAWVGGGASSGGMVASAYQIWPLWTVDARYALPWIGLGAVIGGLNAFLLWRANEQVHLASSRISPSGAETMRVAHRPSLTGARRTAAIAVVTIVLVGVLIDPYTTARTASDLVEPIPWWQALLALGDIALLGLTLRFCWTGRACAALEALFGETAYHLAFAIVLVMRDGIERFIAGIVAAETVSLFLVFLLLRIAALYVLLAPTMAQGRRARHGALDP